MSNYVFGTSLSYRDYLQAESFEDSFKSDISKHTRSIIASNEELQREHISVSEALSTAVSSGFEQLSFDLQTLAQGVSELNATFQWGFSELLTIVGRVNDTLTELVRIAKTPAQTWAYEQFEIARDAFRQDLHHEALEYLDRAINGYAGNTGYKLEYRFHYLLGTIRLGSFRNNSRDVVNLIEAENAFLNAARYARRDQPKEAGRAFLAAGWTAYCQGKMRDAKQYTEQALSLYPDLGEAHFQAAKIQMHVGSPDHALPSLRQAIELDRGYSIKAAADNDFKRYEAKVHALLDTLRQEAKEKAETALVATQQQAVETERRHVQDFSLTKYAELASARRDLDEASGATRHDTYFGYLDALSFCAQARQNLRKAIADFVTRADAEVKQRIAELDGRISRVRNANMGGIWVTLLFVGIITFSILGFTQGSRVDEANTRQEQIRKEAGNRVLAELRRKGYDPNKMSIQEGRRLGYRIEDLPPKDIGSTFSGTWFSYIFWGSLLSVGIAVIGNKTQKSTTIATLQGEQDRLQRIDSEIQKIQAQ